MNTPIPNFINVGPGRCGTSWLFEALQAHPEISMSRIKETEFFNTNYDKGPEWYLENFSRAGGKKAIGEIANNYYLDTSIPEKIKRFNPDMKVIFNVRDPLSLLRSYYQFGIRRGLNFSGEPEDLDTPVGKIMGSGYAYRERAGKLAASDTPTLIQSVLLSNYMKPFLETFSADRVYIFDFEQLRRNPDAELQSIYRFLGVDPNHRLDGAGERVNEALTPKSRMLARLATHSAFLLRRLGAHRALSALHQSRTVKSLLFRPVGAAGGNAPAMPLPEEVEALLIEERRRIAGLNNAIASTWKAAGLI